MSTDSSLSGVARDVIRIRGARENNLKNVSLEIPKRAITVFTGVSGSGKSSLVFGTIAAESQRLLNETYPAFVQGFLPRYGQPDADVLSGLSAAIVVDQQRLGGTSRSTVGTVTDAYALLRVVYARLGRPAAGGPSAFSFNDPQGMCPACGGLGRAKDVDPEALVDRSRSLNGGALLFPTFAVGTPFWTIVAESGFFDPDKPLADYTDEEWERLMHQPKTMVKLAGALGTGRAGYEGLLVKFRRVYLQKDAAALPAHLRAAFDRAVAESTCRACGGTRLGEAARASLVRGRSVADCAAMPVAELAAFVRSLDEPTLAPLLQALAERLGGLVGVGLGYLTLGRESATLSGGESQRVKMVRHLGSSLTDLTYVFDEPSVGLHPHDVPRLTTLLRALCDKGNTVLVVEHRPDVIRVADHAVDMGPRAGRLGGEVVYEGSVAGLEAADTLTGRHLARGGRAVKTRVRARTGEILVQNAALHTLQNVSVRVPRGVLTVVTGVSGAGKSTLAAVCLPEACPEAVVIGQATPRGSARSSPATYTGLFDAVRKAFAQANGVSASLFSANSEGACPACGGLGVVVAEIAHLDPVATVCETCEGARFTREVLAYTLRGRSIGDVLRMTVSEARAFFDEPAVAGPLEALADVGLDYVALGQPTYTLSGGERQRLELATELGRGPRVYVMDEPTTGLHLDDVERLLGLLDRLVDGGSTVVAVEHHLDVVAHADWIVELGPGAGADGGRVLFEGVPEDLLACAESVTGPYLARHAAAARARG